MTKKKKMIAAAEASLVEARDEARQAKRDAIKQERQARRDTLKLAGRMGKLTNTELTQAELDRAARMVRNNPSRTNGALSCWKETGEKSLDRDGKEVSKSRQIFSQEAYKIWASEDYGIAKTHREQSHNLLKNLPARALQFPDYISISDDKRSFKFAETPKTWDKKK